MASVFGLIVSGRLVQTDFEQVDTNKFLITVPNADSINHIVVFMTGQQPLPEQMGAAVHFSWPDPNSPPTWKYLGLLCNQKPSAIFKITSLKNEPSLSGYSGFGFAQPIVSHVAQIGISVEPLQQLQTQAPEANDGIASAQDDELSSGQLGLIAGVGVAGGAGAVNPFAQFISKSAENLFNYVASFSRQLPGCDEQLVPLRCIQNWYESYSRRLQMNPTFWRE